MLKHSTLTSKFVDADNDNISKDVAYIKKYQKICTVTKATPFRWSPGYCNSVPISANYIMSQKNYHFYF